MQSPSTRLPIEAKAQIRKIWGTKVLAAMQQLENRLWKKGTVQNFVGADFG
jgi:hypothetical protein